MTKHPCAFGDCITGDSLISMASGLLRPTRDIQSGDVVRAMWFGPDHRWQVSSDKVQALICYGKRPIYKIRAGNYEIRVSADHALGVVRAYVDPDLAPFGAALTVAWKWRLVTDLVPGDIISVLSSIHPNYEIPDPLTELIKKEGPIGLEHSKITSVERDGEDEVYDLQMANTANFFANGVLILGAVALDRP